MATAPNLPLLTEEQYLAIERQAEIKSEFYQGEMFAMSGATSRHNIILRSLILALGPPLLGRKCSLFFNDLRLKVNETGLYTYPDLMALCEPPQFLSAHQDTLTNPSLIIDILSPSTEAYDRGRKFEHYRAIPSLRNYLLLTQDRIHAELFTREPDNSWRLTECKDLAASIHLPAIDLTVPLASIYEATGLIEEQPSAQDTSA